MPRLCGGALGLDLVAHDADVLGARADEGDVVRGEDLGEAGVLGEEPVAGMDGVGAGDLAGGEELRNVEVGVARRRRADADALVGEADMHGVAVGGRVDRDGGDAEFLAGAEDAERDLAAVGDQDLVEEGRGVIHSMIISGSPYSTGWPSSTMICVDLAGARRGDLVHRLHRLDDEQRLALADRVADVDIGLAARLGAQIGGADHRRGHRAGMVGDGHRSGRYAGRAPRRSPPTRHRRRRRLQRSCDAYAGVLVLDLDLAEAGLVEQFRELADQLLVDDLLLVGHLVLSAALGDQCA